MNDLIKKIECAARVAEKMYPSTQLSAAFRKFADELLKDNETEDQGKSEEK